MSFLVIGNPESLRVQSFVKEAFERGLDAKVCSHYDLLTGKADLDSLLSEGTTIRIESPGEAFPVEKELLKLGISNSSSFEKEKIDKISFDKGRILSGSLWYRGFFRYLERIDASVQKSPSYFMNDPRDILSMYDKRGCHGIFSSGKVNVPKSITASSFDELLVKMEKENLKKIFIKPRFGSGAAGIMAFTWSKRLMRFSLITTVEFCKTEGEFHLYHTKRTREYKNKDEVKLLIENVLYDGAHIERWIPKASVNGKVFDTRVIVIDGKACHRVARVGKGPFTNLKLGCKRVNIEEILPVKTVERIESEAEKAFSMFPDSFYAGVDLMLPVNSDKPFVLEINAFGDLINDLTFEGKTPHGLEIEKWLTKEKNLEVANEAYSI